MSDRSTRNSEGRATQTGANARFEPGPRDQRSNASVFDSLVDSNLQLVKNMKLALLVMGICAVTTTATGIYSVAMLRAGQTDIHNLVNARCR